MRYTVTPDTPIVLGAGGVDAVLQDIVLILNTQQGECPGYRGFGLPRDYVDMPTRPALAVLRNELHEAFQDYSVPALLVSVTGEVAPDGEIVPVVEVEI